MPTYDPNQQFKLYGPDGKIIATGSMSAVTEHILDSKARADAVSLLHDAAYAVGLLERQQIEKQQLDEQKVRALCDAAARLAIRLDAFEQNRIAWQRRDAEEEAARIQQYLDGLPDPNSPDPFAPSGDLHDIPASEPEDREQLQQSDQGTLPPELREGAPASTGTDPEPDPANLAYPPTPRYRSPAAISLNEE